MLTEILSSDKIKLKGSDKPLKSSGEIAEESSQFSKILTSLDKDVKPISSSDVFKNIEAMFEDDKEFLKESLSFLKGRETEPKLIDSELSGSSENILGENSGLEIKNGSIFGLHFANYKSVKEVSTEEQNFKVLINSAKNFLKEELLKKSISEVDMPKTLRGLTQLAESKGISLKDIKFNLEDKIENKNPINEIGDSSKTVKMIINQHSTEALFRGKSQNIVLKAGKTDRTPENLTPTKQTTENSEVKKFDLSALLSATETEIETTDVKTSTLNLSKEVKGLGDILKSENSIEILDKNRDNGKTVSKNIGMTDKIGKSLNMTPEFVASLFSKDDMSDLGIETKTNKISETELTENSILRETDRLRGGLELKIGEAKTMSRHLASNLQEQIDNYKNPFQKMTLTLNPQQLGEVEVDIIKRGNSVKIALSGNAQTINLLSANSMELRTQLINIGLEDPTFKFNEDGRNGSQHQQREQKENKDEIFIEDEQDETLEIESLLI